MSGRLRRVKKVEAAYTRAHPPQAPPPPPGVVFVLEARPDRPAGRWVRPDGLTEVLVYDPAGPEPDCRFPGNPLVLGGDLDPFARDPGLVDGCRFVPAEAPDPLVLRKASIRNSP